MKPKRNNGWWNLDEKQPGKEGQAYLVLTKNGFMVESTWWESAGFDHSEVYGIPFPATHWKPRPKPPTI